MRSDSWSPCLYFLSMGITKCVLPYPHLLGAGLEPNALCALWSPRFTRKLNPSTSELPWGGVDTENKNPTWMEDEHVHLYPCCAPASLATLQPFQPKHLRRTGSAFDLGLFSKCLSVPSLSFDSLLLCWGPWTVSMQSSAERLSCVLYGSFTCQ